MTDFHGTTVTSPSNGSVSGTTLDPLPMIDLHGIPCHAITEAALIRSIIESAKSGHGGWVITLNLDILRRCVRDAEFAAMAEQADLRIADGMPLVWASRLQRTPLPERVAGSSLITPLTEAAAATGLRVFFLGGAPGTARGAADLLKKQYPELEIAGVHCPPLGFEDDPAESALIREVVRDAAPDLVYVALGSPKQENLILALRDLVPRAWWLGIGISFSFLTGDVQRAPVWIQRVGLEWLHRLAQEPRRLARRYLVDGLPFACALLCRAAWRGLTRTTPDVRR